MAEIDKINKNFRTIEKYYDFLKNYSFKDEIEFENSFEEYLAVSMALFNMLNATIEISEELIQEKKLDFPSSYRNIFEILRKNKLLSNDLAKKLINYMFQRNMLAHQYDDLNPSKILDLFNDREIFLDFVKEVKSLF